MKAIPQEERQVAAQWGEVLFPRAKQSQIQARWQQACQQVLLLHMDTKVVRTVVS